MYFLVNMTNALEQSNNIVQVVPQRGTRETNRVKASSIHVKWPIFNNYSPKPGVNNYFSIYYT